MGLAGDPVILALDESPPDHACASVQLYNADLALLNYLLQDLRSLVRLMAQGGVRIEPYEIITWTVHELLRRTVVCDPAGLLEHADVQMVGFLGDRRPECNTTALDQVEIQLLDDFRSYPGILSYSSVELVDNQWANLVVHREPEDREKWREGHTHVYAAEDLAPQIYSDVRIHNGCIAGGPIGSETVVIETTKYWDYDSDPVWHAIRFLPGGATETVGSPWTDIADPATVTDTPAPDHAPEGDHP